MPGLLIQQGALVMCVHGAPAMPMAPNPRVLLSGMPACNMPYPWLVTGCPAPSALMPPCIIATWSAGTTRVTSLGQPLVVQSGVATCMPSGLPLLPLLPQFRVSAM